MDATASVHRAGAATRWVAVLGWVPFFSIGLVVSLAVLVLGRDREQRVQAAQSVLLTVGTVGGLMLTAVGGALVWIVALVAAALLSEVSRDASKVAELVHVLGPLLLGGGYLLFLLATLVARLWAAVSVGLERAPRLPWLGRRAERLTPRGSGR